MNLNELQTILALHQKVFGFLMDCRATGRAGSRPLDESNVPAWQHADTCAAWLRKFGNQISPEFRPEQCDIDRFAHLLSSLFATSFRASRADSNGVVKFIIHTSIGRSMNGDRISKHAREKQRQAAETLRTYALECLAADCELTVDPSIKIDALPVSLDLTLWTYASHLVHRSEYSSQGPAIYLLWLDLPMKTRRNLNADTVWKARTRLIEYLKSKSQVANT